MTQLKPLARTGSQIGSEPIRFEFDGRGYVGQRGDTAASALLANGVRLLGRSVKYRRRRGMIASGADEPNALLTIGAGPDLIPNVPATRLVIKPGMKLFSQNRWPSLDKDASTALRLGKSLFGVGFYYKTFIWPSWKSYEALIRRLAGLGNAPRDSNLPPATRRHETCHVLVAGSGPAGLISALSAARSGKRVMLCESSPAIGGELTFEDAVIDGLCAADWIARVRDSLVEAGVGIHTDTTVVSARDGLAIAHHEPCGYPGEGDGLLHIHAERIIMATGASEHPIAFVNNDLPGVMLMGAADDLLARYGVAVAKRAVLFGNNDRIYATAMRLRRGGIEIAAIVDSRVAVQSELRVHLVADGVQCLMRSTVLKAIGRREVTGTVIGSLDASKPERMVDCDAILTSGGWTPWTDSSDKEQCGHGVTACGAANGKFSLPEVIADAASPAYAKGTEGTPNFFIGRCDSEPALQPIWHTPASLKDEKLQFVDFQNDVTVADLRQSVNEGFGNIEHAKRYTTLGFGTDQGRTSKAIGTATLAKFAGNSDVPRHSKARRPYRSVSLTALSGWRRDEMLRPVRRTPMTSRHLARGAAMQPTGLWMRPQYFTENGSCALEAGNREARRVRAEGGITDISTLGMIEISGIDAEHFVDRICLTKGSMLKPGRGKYALLLREDGFVLEDGIIVRIAEDRFLLMVSTAHAEVIVSHLKYWYSLEWAGRHVALTDVSDGWAGMAVSGERSLGAVHGLLGSGEADRLSELPRMGYLEAEWNSTPVRVVRASFSGEKTFELHTRPHQAAALWDALLGMDFAPYGLEALDILRIEKGFLTGAEMNGQTTPFDLGLGHLVARNPGAIGASLLQRPAIAESTRQLLIGLRATSPDHSFLAGAQITRMSDARPVGYITSAARSPMLGHSIGLALIDGSVAHAESRLLARDPMRGADTLVELAPVGQFDPDNSRTRS